MKKSNLVAIIIISIVVLAVAYATANTKSMVQYKVYCTDCENKGQTPYSYEDFEELVKLGEVDSKYSK